MNEVLWHFSDLRTGAYWEGPLEAYWEVYLDSISDGYTPHDISAENLLRQWLYRIEETKHDHANGLVPIQWFVRSSAAGIYPMPFAFDHFEGKQQVEDFQQLFTWPQSTSTGYPLNWLTLPVADKHWNEHQTDRGGFIQEATGWKPGILQPTLYVPSLVWATGTLP